MISKSLFLALPLLLGAIAQAHAACDASAAQGFVGQPADPQTMQDAVKAAGASSFETYVAPPGKLTKDFNKDRLIIYTDQNNKIKSLGCF